MARDWYCVDCGKYKYESEMVDDMTCIRCDEKHDPKQTELAEFYDHIANPTDLQSDTSLEVIKE